MTFFQPSTPPVTVHEPRVTSVQASVEPRRYFPCFGRSDDTEAIGCEASDVPSLGCSWTSREYLGDGAAERGAALRRRDIPELATQDLGMPPAPLDGRSYNSGKGPYAPTPLARENEDVP